MSGILYPTSGSGGDRLDHDDLSDGEVTLAFGANVGGELVHISQADRGKACNLKCPACDDILIASKSERKARAHHFRHLGNKQCKYGPETAAHKYGKEVIAEEKYLWLPSMEATFGERRHFIQGRTKASVTSVRLEIAVDKVVPDLIVSKGDRELLVEIFVTHRVGEKKLAKLRAMGRGVLEINLSKVRHADLPRLKREILSDAPREWLYHPWIEEAREKMRREEQDRVAKIEAEREARIEKLLQTITRLPAASAAGGRNHELNTHLVASVGIERFIGRKIHGDGLFPVARAIWQTSILAQFAGQIREAEKRSYFVNSVHISVEELCEQLVHEGVLRQELLDKEYEENHDRLKQLFSKFAAPRRVVRGYLSVLEREGLLVRSYGDCWGVVPLEKIPRSETWEQNRTKERNRADFKRLLKQIMHEGSYSGPPEDFDEDAWWSTTITSLGSSPEEIIEADESSELTELRNRLLSLAANMSPYYPAKTVDLLGLPLEQRFREIELRRREITEKKAQEEKAKRRHEFQSNRYYFSSDLAWQTWAYGQLDALNGQSPADYSEQSDTNLREMATSAAREGRRQQAEIARKQAAESARTELQEIVSKAISDEVKARLWLNSANPNLGRKRPIDMCVDKAALEQCRRELARIKKR